LNFLGNGEIRRIKIKIKKASNMGGVTDVSEKIHISPLTLEIT
jgi:hypothetical protein